MTDHPTESGQVRPFATVLQDLRKGAVLDEAALLLQDLVAAVLETGKKGKLTLTVEVALMKGDADTLTVAAQATTSKPKAPAKAAVFFADSDFNLVRDDPRQAALPGLREVSRTTSHDNIKEIAK